MERGFDFYALLKNHEKQHKNKPDQFKSVQNGIKKRLDNNISRRRSSRLTIFDRIRNLPQNSPVTKPSKADEMKQKVEQRRMQLEKWKQEKEQRKREAAAQKKKPFVVGLPRSPPKLGPVHNKVMPSMSGRVTRSQSSKHKPTKSNSPAKTKKSFAPENATFVPPTIKGMDEVPVLLVPSKKKGRVTMVHFQPVITEIDVSNSVISKPKQNSTEKKTNKKKEETYEKPVTRRNTRAFSKSMAGEIGNSGDAALKSKNVKEKTKIDIVKPQNNKINKTSKNTKDQADNVKKTNKTQSTSQTDSSMDEPNVKGSKIKTTGKKNNSNITSSSSYEDTNMNSEEQDSANDVNSDVNTSPKFVSSKITQRKSLQNKAVTVESSTDAESPVQVKTRKSRVSLNENAQKPTPKYSLRRSIRKSHIPSKPDVIDCIVVDSTNSETSLDSPITKKPYRKSMNNNKYTPRKSLQLSSKVTPIKPLPNSESKSEEKLKSPKDIPLTPEDIKRYSMNVSPCVTMSRGKDNARREMQQKLREGILDLDYLSSVDEFHQKLNCETDRLTKMADHWEEVKEKLHDSLPEVVHEAILGAVGQARLLMSKKFRQFAGLIERCEAPDPNIPAVTTADLQGFWDMVYMQVENLNMRFNKLVEMEKRNWSVEEDCIEPPEKKPANRTRNDTAVRRPRNNEIKSTKTFEIVSDESEKSPLSPNKVYTSKESSVESSEDEINKAKTKKPAPSSRIRDIIAAARRAKKQEQKEQEPSKTFEGGFFCVTSPVKSAPPKYCTPNKPSLLKSVLSSEAKKASVSKSNTSYAMQRASMIGKNVEDDADSFDLIQFTPINLNATPAKSILKSNTASCKKSIKMVLFNSGVASPSDISGIHTLDTESDNSPLQENDEEEFIPKEDTIKEKSFEKTTDDENNEVIHIQESIETIDKETEDGGNNEVIQIQESIETIDKETEDGGNNEVIQIQESIEIIDKDTEDGGNKENGKNKPKRSKVKRQNAVDKATPSVLRDSPVNVVTPRRSMRRKTFIVE